MLQKVFTAGLLTILLSLLSQSAAFAQAKPGTPVQLDVPDTTLTLQGYAAPGALVTFREGGSVIGTTVASSTGAYSVTLGSQATGLRTIDAYFTDADNNQSKTLTQAVSVQVQQNTVLDGFLSPTIVRRTPEVVQQGSVIQISGYTVANSSVNISLGFSGSSLTTVSDGNGFYEFLLDTAGLNVGTYSATTQTTLTLLQTSDRSLPVNFQIESEDGPTGPDIVVSPDQLPPPIPQSPDDGDVIDENEVTVSGESVPNAQINIFENGVLIGSIFANEFGQWSFVYEATSSPVTLSFEACIDGVCSVLSKNVTLTFANLGACRSEFNLQRYRFWGVDVNSPVTLAIDNISGDGVIEIDWGDGTVETFDYDSDQPQEFLKAYSKLGNFNGTATFYEGRTKQDADCKVVRYFSVHVVSESASISYWRIFWLFIIASAAYIINHYASDKEKSRP